ncbi:hydrogen gas-evolving membrane-bound hydrogenase subunit E [Haloferacaceae archaeon DSL9]
MLGFSESQIVLAVVFLPFVAAGSVPLLFRVLGDRTGYVGVAVALCCFGLLFSLRGATRTVSAEWIPSLGVALRFYVDGWALLFALLASGIGALIFAYSSNYMHDEPRLARYYAALLAFMGSILGVALAADLVALFLFWELTSICSFILIGHHSSDPESQSAARMAMFVTVGGGLFLLAGFLLLSLASATAFGVATFDLTAMLADADGMRSALRGANLFGPSLALIAVGVASKSAQVPLHFWLPSAMAAPTPVSAFLHSATMVKVGVYLLGRLRPLLVSPEWTALFVAVGLSTMAITAVLAVAATDIKGLLAYSTASHLGLMVAAFGFESTLGAEAGVFHLFNHALFKAALFLVAGIVAHEAGTRRLADLGGLGRALPLTALVAAVAGLGMAGVPPFNGFYSKELFFEAAYESAHVHGGLWWLFPTVAVVASAFTVLYSARFLAVFFGGRPRPDREIHRPPVALVVPPAVLGLAAAVVTVDPTLAIRTVVQPGVDATAVDPHPVHVGLPTALTPAATMTAIALGLGGASYLFVDSFVAGIRRLSAGLAALHPSAWYRTLVDGAERTGAVAAPRIHNGLLRTYAMWILAGMSALTLAGYVATSASLPGFDGLEVSVAVALVLVVAVVAAVAVVIAPSHVAGVLTLSLLGFMVAIFYILASAPDLALTQLVVETLVLLIFLLVLERLPEYYGEIDLDYVARDAALSVLVGVTVFATVLFSTRERLGEASIAQGFVERAIPEAGGTNVVNVILVDFRGLDTLGETAVVVMAALSVLLLTATRKRGEGP